LDAAVVYCALESCLAQSRDRGDLNPASYVRHLAVTSSATPSSVDSYVLAHDALAAAAAAGQLGVILTDDSEEEDLHFGNRNGSLAMPV